MSEQQGIVVTPRLLWAMLSAAAVVAGSLGPWITIGALTVSGTGEGRDGLVTLVLGILAFGLVVAKRARPAVAAVAGAALAVGLIDTIQLLRIEDNELFSISVGWGLIVLNLGAASLLVWGVMEVFQSDASRRGLFLVGATVAVVAAAGVLAASGRFDDPNDDSDSVAKVEQSPAEETPKKPPAPTGPGSEPCDKLGINAEERREGDCLAENGWKVQVVNRFSTAKLDEIEVSVKDIVVLGSLVDLAGDDLRPEGVFVEAKLRITNRGRQPINLSDGLFALTANGTTNTPTQAILGLEDQLGSGGDLGPGLSRTGLVTFDVAQSTADAVARDGNIVVAQPSDDGGLSDPQKRVAFVRTYGEEASTPTTPDDPPEKEPVPDANSASGTKLCGNLTVTEESVTCPFAQNVFYEYWEATDGGDSPTASISAFSDALGENVELTCDDGGASVTCVTGVGGEITMPHDALAAYTRADANEYARNNTVSTSLAERGRR